jgi:hypothetical protein
VFELNEGIKIVYREDGAFIYNEKNGSVKIVNETGKMILELVCCKGIMEIVNKILEEYSIDERVNNVEQEVVLFLSELEREGIVCKR